MTISHPPSSLPKPGTGKPMQYVSRTQRMLGLLPLKLRRRLHQKRPAREASRQMSEAARAILLAAWADWTRGGGKGECRAEAFDRLTAWLNANRPEQMLDLSALGLTCLPDHLPRHARELNVGGNRLRTLPQLPACLRHLDAHGNRLTSLPSLPDTVEVIEAHGNRLTALPENLPADLKELYVESNRLRNLPDALPSKLASLFAYSNRLSALPALPDTLEVLELHGNQLKDLPSQLPANLRELYADSNKLASLPEALPDTLAILDIRNNRLKALPAHRPKRLVEIAWSCNPMQALPDTWQARRGACSIANAGMRIEDEIENHGGQAMPRKQLDAGRRNTAAACV